MKVLLDDDMSVGIGGVAAADAGNMNFNSAMNITASSNYICDRLTEAMTEVMYTTMFPSLLKSSSSSLSLPSSLASLIEL